MAKGKLYPAEFMWVNDAKTGARIRQITSHTSDHHHPFFMIPAYDDQMNRLYFVSHRTGNPQIFAEQRSSHTLVQLTDRADLAEWSFHPSHDGRYVYFTAGTGAWRVNTQTLEEEMLLDFGQVEMRDAGMVASGMGTTALSFDDRWWAVRFTVNAESCLAVIDTARRTYEIILRRDTISHMQFCPDDANLLFYAGPLTDRVWIINRDGTNHRRLYARNAAKKEWITHESWIPGTRELAFVDWPHGIRCVQVDTGQERRVASFNAWHAICSRSGTMMTADTNFPDIGIQLFDPRDGVGTPATLCYPASSSMGKHWAGPFPYDDGPIEVYAPQHTHPHPSFSPDERFAVYTSDCTGNAQLYEVELSSLDFHCKEGK